MRPVEHSTIEETRSHIRRCLRNGPKDAATILLAAKIAHMLRFGHGLDYHESMQVVQGANNGTVENPREVWEELLQVVDIWESQT